MDNHFNAFISYKHATEDNIVADAVHRELEHFHIPGKLRKKTGIRKINRIFCDKAELPITSDLSDTIADALANSDYLIVLCSTNTKESAWVPREIEFFLKNHTKREIFTVLVNGEPRDVIPEILQYEERVETDEDGNEQTVRIPIEPLSCDYRMPLKKAKKEELPRLVSGLIGCAYDEIMQRQRQYRLRQLTAAFSVTLAVVLGFAGYMLYSRNRIQRNYLDSLRNQSRYLANESAALLDKKEQRITALELALEALPKDDSDDRPITAEAVKAITKATLAYEGNDGNNVHAAWNYTMPNTVEDFYVSPDGKTLAVLADGGITSVWNTETHEQIVYLDNPDSEVRGIGFADDRSFLVWNKTTLYCYDTGSGSKQWEYTLTRKDGTFDDNGNFMVTDSVFYIGAGDGVFLEMDASSGEVKKELSIPGDDEKKDFSVVESHLSPDRKKIAFRGLIEVNKYTYGVLDIASGRVEISDPVPKMIKDIAWADNNTIMIADTKVDETGSVGYGDIEIVSTDHTGITCVSAFGLTKKWTADFVCNGVNVDSGFDAPDASTVAYHSGNVVTLYELATGKVKYSNNVNSSVVYVNDRDGDGVLSYITADGGYAFPMPTVDTDAVYYTKTFTDNLWKAVINEGVYVVQKLSNDVIYYGTHVYDEEWTPICNDAIEKSLAGAHFLGKDYLVVLRGSENNTYLHVFDLNKEGHVQTDFTGNVYGYKILGISGDRVCLGYSNENSYELITVGAADGKVERKDLFKRGAALEKACKMVNGKLVYCFRDENNRTRLVILDPAADTKNEIELPENIASSAGSIKEPPTYYEEDNTVFVQGDVAYMVDVENGTTARVSTPDGWAGACCCSDIGLNGVFAVSDGKSILLVDKDGNVSNTIRCPGVRPIGMTFTEDQLLTVDNDAAMCWYAADTGQFNRKTEISMYYQFDDSITFEQDRENGFLYIHMYELTDIVDMESGIEITAIDRSFGYHKEKDVFYSYATDEKENVRVGYYRRYTVPELIEKAHNILQNTELPDELKERYGIDM